VIGETAPGFKPGAVRLAAHSRIRHQFPRTSAVRLLPDCVRDRDVADVVQQGSNLQPRHPFGDDAERLAGRTRQPRDHRGVAVGERRLQAGDVVERRRDLAQSRAMGPTARAPAPPRAPAGEDRPDSRPPTPSGISCGGLNPPPRSPCESRMWRIEKGFLGWTPTRARRRPTASRHASRHPAYAFVGRPSRWDPRLTASSLDPTGAG
jgi:hypothetical protein